MRHDRPLWRWNSDQRVTRFLHGMNQVYERVGRQAVGWFQIFKDSLSRFIEMRGLESAASMAYFALFSLFPLTLLLIALMGYVIDSDMAYRQALDSIRRVFPFSGEVLDQNLKEVLQMRGTFGAISVLFMVWSASGYFNTMVSAVNRAWPMVKLRTVVQNRLVAVAMIGLLILLLLLSLVSTTVINLLPWLLLEGGAQDLVASSPIWQSILRISAAAFTFLMFVSIYRWMPNKVVRWRAVILGAALTALAWELSKMAFSIYLASGLGAYRFLYGSLGALAALLFWVYLSSSIALFGAHLVATIDIAADLKANKPQHGAGAKIFAAKAASPEHVRQVGAGGPKRFDSNPMGTPEKRSKQDLSKRIRG